MRTTLSDMTSDVRRAGSRGEKLRTRSDTKRKEEQRPLQSQVIVVVPLTDSREADIMYARTTGTGRRSWYVLLDDVTKQSRSRAFQRTGSTDDRKI